MNQVEHLITEFESKSNILRSMFAKQPTYTRADQTLRRYHVIECGVKKSDLPVYVRLPLTRKKATGRLLPLCCPAMTLTVALLLILLLYPLFAQAQQQQPLTLVEQLLNPDGTLRLERGFNGSVDVKGWQMHTDPDGTPRFFKSQNTQTLVPLDTLWDNRFTVPGLSGTVSAIALSGTDVYAGGSFAIAGGVLTNYIAKWNGVNWSALGSGMDGPVYALAVSGTDLYAGGAFTEAGGVAANFIAKWNGTTWSGLGSGMDNPVRALAVSGTDMYAGGEFTTAGGIAANYTAKWNGTSWSGLGNGMDGVVYALAVSGTNLYAGGEFTTAGIGPANYVAKWNGATWSEPGGGMDGVVYALTVSGTDVYVGGEFTTAGIVTANNIAKWNGTTWSEPGGGMDAPVYALTVSGTDVYAGGEFSTAGGVDAISIAKWNGTTWSEPGGGTDGGVYALAVSVTDVYAGGDFGTAGEVSAKDIAKWNGTSWSPINIRIKYPLNTIAVNGTDVYAGGDFIAVSSVSVNYIAKWDGASWSALGTGMNNSVRALAVNGTDVYAGGDFTTAGGAGANRIAKWNGTSWSALGTGMNNSVLALAVSGTDVYAGGNFTTAGGVAANYIAKWNGTSWSALGIGMNNSVLALAVNSTDVYAGGNFTTAGGVSANRTAKWNGTSWSALGSGANNVVRALAVSGTDLYAGGSFTTAGNKVSAFIARWAPNNISGIKFDDLNANRRKDPGEPGLSGWTINLSGTASASTVTDVNGIYNLTDIIPGAYAVSESQQTNWYQTYPVNPETYAVTFSNIGTNVSGKDFGNVYGYRYIGPTGGDWSVPSNWLGNHIPQPTDVAVIPTTVIVDALPNDSIRGLIILNGGILNFTSGALVMKVAGSVVIKDGGEINYPGTVSGSHTNSLQSLRQTYQLICYGDWINNGNFSPGDSKITFAGNRLKIIFSDTANSGFSNKINLGAKSTTFKVLEVSGDSAFAIGNIIILEKLILKYNLTPRTIDTVFIQNSATTAIEDAGKIPRGSIQRSILQGEMGAYRYESDSSFIKFNGTGTYPSTIMITTYPDTMATDFGDRWEAVSSVVNTVANVLRAENITDFSKWTFGHRPRAVGPLPVRRVYSITPKGGSSFTAVLSLRYEQSEVPEGTTEDSLQLLRAESDIAEGWNMVSVPYEFTDYRKTVLFPTATSNAFLYQGGYIPKDTLANGVGYWLKFPLSQDLPLSGEERRIDTIDVNIRWNMIGTLSSTISVSAVTALSPASIISPFYGFHDVYSIEDTLRPMKAYWVKMSEAGKLVMDAGSGLAKRYQADDVLKTLNTLTIKDANDIKQTLYFGKVTDDKLKQESSWFELPPLPPVGIFDARFASNCLVETIDGNHSLEYPILISSAEYPVTISWSLKSHNIFASLVVDEQEMSMRADGSTKILNPKSVIRIRINEAENLPEKYSLEQNYPNPFNPLTEIQYAVPSRQYVSLKIYDILGREVATLVNEKKEPGEYIVSWDASDKPTGIYIYRLIATPQSGNQSTVTMVRKMLLIR